MNSNQMNLTFFDGFMMGNEYKEYLDKTGALEALAKAIDSLRNEPEWPQNPKEYIRKQLALLCGAPPDPLVELKEARAKVAHLKKENREIRERVARKYAAAARERSQKPPLEVAEIPNSSNAS